MLGNRKLRIAFASLILLCGSSASQAQESAPKPQPRPIWSASLIPALVSEYKRAVSRAERGWEGSELGLARMLDYGLGTQPDPQKAVELYQKAVDKGSYIAAQSLGTMYAIGNGIQRDVDEADKWFRKAKDLGGRYPCMPQVSADLLNDKESVVALCALHTLTRTLLWYPMQARQDGDEGTVDVGINFKRLEIRVIKATAPESLQASAKNDLKKFIKVVPMPEKLLAYDSEIAVGFNYMLSYDAKPIEKQLQSR